jgi:XTP/dITP diphosphohydrolase
MQKIILATRNPGKVREIEAILHGLDMQLLSLSDFPSVPDVIEDGETLEENALKKARQVFEATKIPALADDSGLEVLALNMQPGVYSARYAGEHVSYEDNNRKLLTELHRVPSIQRCAQFRCVAAFVDSSMQKTAEGICRGSIVKELRGTGGFGYDPLFMPEGYTQTFAELPAVIKNSMSHRAHAFASMREFLKNYFISSHLRTPSQKI